MKKTSYRPNAKHWCLTINNYNDIPDFKSMGLDYWVCGKEIGEKGTPHLQSYLVFTNRQKLSSIKKLFPTCHAEIAKSSPKEASEYCKKDKDYIEGGTLPLTATEESIQWALVKSQAKENKLDDINPKVYITCYNTIKRIASDHRIIPADLMWEDNQPPNEWIYGPSGTGKSRKARYENPGHYLKMPNKWWENYQDEDVVIIEDVGMTHDFLGDLLKIWADRYGFRAEVKHLSLVLRPKKIIVTSNYHIKDLWPDKGVYEPLLRRFKMIELK